MKEHPQPQNISKKYKIYTRNIAKNQKKNNCEPNLTSHWCILTDT